MLNWFTNEWNILDYPLCYMLYAIPIVLVSLWHQITPNMLMWRVNSCWDSHKSQKFIFQTDIVIHSSLNHKFLGSCLGQTFTISLLWNVEFLGHWPWFIVCNQTTLTQPLYILLPFVRLLLNLQLPKQPWNQWALVFSLSTAGWLWIPSILIWISVWIQCTKGKWFKDHRFTSLNSGL